MNYDDLPVIILCTFACARDQIGDGRVQLPSTARDPNSCECFTQIADSSFYLLVVVAVTIHWFGFLVFYGPNEE